MTFHLHPLQITKLPCQCQNISRAFFGNVLYISFFPGSWISGKQWVCPNVESRKCRRPFEAISLGTKKMRYIWLVLLICFACFVIFFKHLKVTDYPFLVFRNSFFLMATLTPRRIKDPPLPPPVASGLFKPKCSTPLQHPAHRMQKGIQFVIFRRMDFSIFSRTGKFSAE